jgi:hypothetical protein
VRKLRVLMAISACVAAFPVVASHADVPVLDQKCSTNADIATVALTTRSGHAIAGTWRLAPRFFCQEAESGLSVQSVLTHDGKTFLASGGECASTVPSCTTATGPVRAHRLGQNVRGRYVLHLTVTLTGPDAALVKGCSYTATTMTATCTDTSDPIVIR